jgi:putative DNA primase/helicase
MGADQNGTRTDAAATDDWDGVTRPLDVPMVLAGPRKKVQSETRRKRTSPTEAQRPTAHPSGADKILDLATDLQADGSLELFHDGSGEPYAGVSSPLVTGVRTVAVHSGEFEQLFLRAMIQRQRSAGQPPRAVSQPAWHDASRTLAAMATHDRLARTVYTRVARLEDPPRVVIDLGDDSGCAVVVTDSGWMVTDDPPVAFRRSPHMRPLPVPQRGGQPDRLRKYIHVSDSTYPLVLAWTVNALAGTVPYVILVLYGEQDSAKSTSARILRRLIDPAQPEHRGLPRDERDLVIAAFNNYVLGFDNLSRLDLRWSDAFCRLSDGSGFGTRRLYSDRGEEVFSGARPILLTGIEPPTSAPDLLDRSYLVEASRIVPSERRDERELFAEFERDRPQLLGSLLDGVATALAHLESVQLDQAPRRADAARFAIAAEPGLGLAAGSIERAFGATRQQAMTVATEASPFLEAVIDLIEERQCFEGTMKSLLAILEERLRSSKPSGWPTSSNAASSALKRGAPILRQIGIDVEHHGPRGKQRNRLWTITARPVEPTIEDAIQ